MGSVVQSEHWRDRCDWCNWPLEFDYLQPENETRRQLGQGGCFEDSCSMRPRPRLGEVGELKRRVRELEKAVGVMVPTILRCYLKVCEPGDREVAEKTLARVNLVMGYKI